MNYLARDAHRIQAALPDGVDAPEDSDSLFLIYAVLLRAKGAAVTAEDVHNAWAAWMAAREPEHDAIRPFAELDPAVRAEDSPYVAAIRRVAEA